jgi:hypothetical protein
MNVLNLNKSKYEVYLVVLPEDIACDRKLMAFKIKILSWDVSIFQLLTLIFIRPLLCKKSLQPRFQVLFIYHRLNTNKQSKLLQSPTLGGIESGMGCHYETTVHSTRTKPLDLSTSGDRHHSKTKPS